MVGVQQGVGRLQALLCGNLGEATWEGPLGVEGTKTRALGCLLEATSTLELTGKEFRHEGAGFLRLYG